MADLPRGLSATPPEGLSTTPPGLSTTPPPGLRLHRLKRQDVIVINFMTTLSLESWERALCLGVLALWKVSQD